MGDNKIYREKLVCFVMNSHNHNIDIRIFLQITLNYSIINTIYDH